MTTGARGALLTVSIDLELDIEQQAQGRDGELETVTTQLRELLRRADIGATWAVADPALSAATQQILAAGMDHEIAVLGDRSWVGHGAGRARFARELTRRVLSARAAGLPVTTLALRHAELDEHLDLLVKTGISVVRGCTPASGATRPTRSSWLRHGVWEAAATMSFPTPRRWFRFVDRWTANRALRSAVRERGSIHLVVDAARLVDSDGAGLRTIEMVLQCASRLRDRGDLHIAPLRDLPSFHQPETTTTRLHSILRPAA